MQIVNAVHVLSELQLSITSPVIAHSPINVSITNYPNIVNSFSWNFGDGRKQLQTKSGSVSHTYLYAASFPLKVQICSQEACRSITVSVKVKGYFGMLKLSCPNATHVSQKVPLSALVLNAWSAGVKWSRTSASGTEYGMYVYS